MRMRVPAVVVAVVAMCLLTAGGCGGGGGGGGRGASPPEPEPEARLAVVGTVRDADGAPVERVAVEVALDRNADGLFETSEAAFVVTDASGAFAVQPDDPADLPDGGVRVRVTARSAGFMTAQRVLTVDPAGGPERVDLTLQSGVEAPVADDRITASVPVDAAGTTGQVEVAFEELDEPLPEGATARVAYVNPRDMATAFPGEPAGASLDGRDALLVSAGVVRVEVSGPDGAPVAPRGRIAVTTPLPRELWPRLEDADPSTTDRVEVPLWWYDQERAQWVQADAYGVLVDEAGEEVPPERLFDIAFGLDDPGALWIRGEVPHLSSWNCDYTGPATGFAGQVAGAAADAAVCAEGGLCTGLDDEGRFRLPHPVRPKPSETVSLVANLLDGLAEDSAIDDEVPPPGGGAADPCPDYEAVATRSVDRVRGQVKGLLRSLKNAYQDNPQLQTEILAAYRSVHRAKSLRDVSTALRSVMAQLPGRDLAAKYGADFMAYFEETTYDEALNSIKGTVEGLKDLAESFYEVDITTCKDVAQDVFGIQTDLGQILKDERKRFKDKKGDLNAYLDLKDRFTDWGKNTLTNLINNQTFVHCVKELARNVKNLPKGAKASELLQALKNTGSVRVWIEGQGKTLSSFKQLFKGGKTVDGSGVLLGILIDEVLLAVKQQKEIMPRALDFEYWQRVTDTLNANERIASRYVARYRKLLGRGEISQGCYDRLSGLVRGSGGGSGRAAGRALAAGEDGLLELEEGVDALEAESPEAAEILRRLYYHVLHAEAAHNLVAAVRLLRGRVTAYDGWTDWWGRPADAPPDPTGGGATTRLYLVDSWGQEHALAPSDRGVDPEAVGLPNALEFRDDPRLRFRQVGTFELADPSHTFRGRLVDAAGNPVQTMGTAEWEGRTAYVYADPEGRFVLSGAFEPGDRLSFRARGAGGTAYTLGPDDLDRPDYRDIVLGRLLTISDVAFTPEPEDPTRVGFQARFQLLPAGEVGDAFASARLASVERLDTGQEALEGPVAVGLDGAGDVTLPGPGRYRFWFEVTDTEGVTSGFGAVYAAKADTIRAEPIEVLTDLSAYRYGDPIRVRVTARDEQGLPLTYRWSVRSPNAAGFAAQESGTTDSEYAFVPMPVWDPAAEGPPEVVVTVRVSGPVDEEVLTTRLELPQPVLEPVADAELTGVYRGGELTYTLEARAAIGESSSVRPVATLGIASLAAAVGEGDPVLDAGCSDRASCSARTALELAPGAHEIVVTARDTRGVEARKTLSVRVPGSVAVTAEPSADDDLHYAFSVVAAFPDGAPHEGMWYAWSFDGLSWSDPAREGTADHTYGRYGHYLVYARAFLPDGSTILAEKAVAVLPRVTPTVSAFSGVVPLAVRFALEDQGGLANLAAIRWDPTGATPVDELTDGGASFSFTYDQAGLYTPRVFLGLGDGTWIPVALGSEPLAVSSPVALELGAEPASGQAPMAVAFTASADLTASSYAWDFDGDGTVDRTTTEPAASYTYAEPGTYRATVTGAFGENAYAASAEVRVAGAATVVLTDGARPLAGETVYRFSAADPFRLEGADATDTRGRVPVSIPSAVGTVVGEDGDYAGYRLRYVDTEGTEEVTLNRTLTAQTVFAGLDDPAIDRVWVYGSNGMAVFSALDLDQGAVTVENASSRCYLKDGALRGAYLVDVARWRNPVGRRAPYVVASPYVHTYYLVTDVPLGDGNARVDLAALPQIASGMLRFTFSRPVLQMGSPTAYARVEGLPVEIPVPVSAYYYGSEWDGTYNVPAAEAIQSLRFEAPLRDGTWGAAGAMEITVGPDVLAALGQEGEAEVSVDVAVREVGLPADWTVCQRLGGTCYGVANESGRVHLVYPEATPLEFTLQITGTMDGAGRTWTVKGRPDALPDAWDGAPAAVDVSVGSVGVDPNTAAVTLEYQSAGDAATCDVTLWPAGPSGTSVDLEATGIPASLTRLVFEPFAADLPWFGGDGVMGMVRCCDGAGNCAAASFP